MTAQQFAVNAGRLGRSGLGAPALVLVLIAGIAASFSNTVLVGIPLVQQAFGNEMLQVMLLIVTIHLPVMLLVSSFLVEYAAYADQWHGTSSFPIKPGKNTCRRQEQGAA